MLTEHAPVTQLADRRPRYVREIDHQRRQDEAELAALSEHLVDLRRYLLSPKFNTSNPLDRYVNVADVLLRLDEAVSASLRARAEVI